MSRMYTDAEMQIASQMAYWDIPAGMTLREYINTHSGDSDVQKVVSIISDNNLDGNGYSCLDWSIKAVGNDQSRSGMYGCMIDDGYGGALFAFRGSEGDGQFMQDWIAGDFGMLNNTDTWQQEMGREFVRRMYEQYGDEYDGFAFTGHSLGGNLAIDAAINAPAGMRDKITSVVGLDSPGFPQEYWDKYRQQIDEMRNRIKHYQWSIVGSIFETPCSVDRTINTKSWHPDIPGVGDQHSILNMDTTNGSVYDRPGGRTDFENNINKASNHADEPGIDIIAGGIAAGAAYIAHKEEERLREDARRRGDNDMKITVASDSDTATELEANFAAMMTMEELFRKSETILTQISGDLDNIAGTIKYHSIVGGLLKMRMQYLSNRYENDYHVANALGNVIESTVSEYKKGDLDVVHKYEALMVSGVSTGITSATQAGIQNIGSVISGSSTAFAPSMGLNAAVSGMGFSTPYSDFFGDLDAAFDDSLSDPMKNIIKHHLNEYKIADGYEILRDLFTGDVSYDTLKKAGKITIDTIGDKTSFGSTMKAMLDIYPTLMGRAEKWDEVVQQFVDDGDLGRTLSYGSIGGLNEIFHGVADGGCKLLDSTLHLSYIGNWIETYTGVDLNSLFNDGGTFISDFFDGASDYTSEFIGGAIDYTGEVMGDIYSFGKDFIGSLF